MSDISAIRVGQTVPDFDMETYDPASGQFGKLSLAEQKAAGKWTILVFYPADFTFVCPTELGDMADNYARFQEMGVEVYSVSTDTHFTHKAWHDTSETVGKITYPMLADPTGALSRAFGVYIESDGLAYRGTFVVNPEGKIKVVEMHDNGIGRNAEELIRKVQAAQFIAAHPDEVCPAKWTPGADTLKPGLDLVGKI
jgi:peroxiredoxin (alkyl hydroperoxide reductase subunit C)